MARNAERHGVSPPPGTDPRTGTDPGEDLPDLLASRASSRRTGAMTRHRTTARGVSSPHPHRTSRCGRRRVPRRGSEAGPRRRQADRLPADRQLPVHENYGDPRGQRHATPASTSRTCRGARRSSPPRRAASRWHTTSSRAGCMLYLYGTQRHDIHLHPPQQRPHRDGPRTAAGASSAPPIAVEDGAQGHGRRADRAGTATRATPRETTTSTSRCTRGRRRREPDPVPERRRAPALPGHASARRSRSACAACRSRPAAARSSSARRRCAGGPAGSGRRSSASGP